MGADNQVLAARCTEEGQVVPEDRFGLGHKPSSRKLKAKHLLYSSIQQSKHDQLPLNIDVAEALFHLQKGTVFEENFLLRLE